MTAAGDPEAERLHRRDLLTLPDGHDLAALPASAGPTANPFADTELDLAVNLWRALTAYAAREPDPIDVLRRVMAAADTRTRAILAGCARAEAVRLVARQLARPRPLTITGA